ncbi:MAG: hypothetical protein QOE39_2993, partial [Bradyrhizobium sp.]|nr:hypothetical protein [Bradyrhizobium sp.]
EESADPGAGRPPQEGRQQRPVAEPAERSVRARERPSVQPLAQPWPWAQRAPEPGLEPERQEQLRTPSALLPPTRRKAAHAAGPARPRYGNSLRKTLSERKRPKPLQAPTPSRFGRLSPCQLRRIRDRPCRLGQLPAFIQRRAKRSMPTSIFGAYSGRILTAVIKLHREQFRIKSARCVAGFMAPSHSRFCLWCPRFRPLGGDECQHGVGGAELRDRHA